MRVLSVFKFFENVTTPQESNIRVNNIGSNLVLQVDAEGTFGLEVQGKTNLESDSFYPLATVNTADSTIGNVISESGIYNISVEGISNVKIVATAINGTVTAFGKVIER